jgi:hypothetical protein
VINITALATGENPPENMESTLKLLNSQLAAAKNERDVIELSIGLSADTSCCHSGAVQVLTEITGGPYIPDLGEVSSQTGRSATLQLLTEITGSPYNGDN